MPSSSKPTLPSPPPSSSSSSSSPNRWGPYSSSKDFDANIATILIIVVGASAFSFALHAAITFLLRCYSRRRAQHHEDDNTIGDPKEPSPHFAEAFPTLVFTSGAGTTKVAGTQGAECAICLADFVDGDRVRVLPACNHGFHVNCVQKWLSSKPSCPTCRRSCHPEEP